MFNRILGEWRRDTLIHINKNKGDILNDTNYYGVKLVSYTMKLWESVINHTLKHETKILKNKFGFYVNEIYQGSYILLGHLTKKYRETYEDLFMVFYWPRESVWWDT